MGTDGADFTDGEIDFSSGRRIAIHPYLWLERFKQYRSRSRAKALASLRDAFRVASVTGGGASLDWLDRRLRICEPSGFKGAGWARRFLKCSKFIPSPILEGVTKGFELYRVKGQKAASRPNGNGSPPKAFLENFALFASLH